MNGAASTSEVPESIRALMRSVLGDLTDRFPEDVAIAWHTAQALKALAIAPASVTVEPWPPMRTKAG
jgi:hypothetical protein